MFYKRLPAISICQILKGKIYVKHIGTDFTPEGAVSYTIRSRSKRSKGHYGSTKKLS
jgi:hypothetical protein